MNKLIILVICSNEPHYLKLEQIAKETWASGVHENIDIYFLHHDPEIKTSYIDGNIIYCKSEAGLENIGYKTIESFNLLKNYDFKYIFRTNLSSYIDQDKLYQKLLDLNADYGGLPASHEQIPFCSGAGYLLSKKSIHKIIKNQELWDHNYIDDVALGLLMKTLGVGIYGNFGRQDIFFENPSIQEHHFHYRIKFNNDRHKEYEVFKQIYKQKSLIKL